MFTRTYAWYVNFGRQIRDSRTPLLTHIRQQRVLSTLQVYKTMKSKHLLKEKCAIVFQQVQGCIHPREYFGAWGSLTGKYLFHRSTKISYEIDLINQTAAFAIKTQFGRESK